MTRRTPWSIPAARSGDRARRRGRAALAALLVALAAVAVPGTPTRAANAVPRVAIIVGPVAGVTASYLSLAEAASRVARDAGAQVVEVYTPNATWPAVKRAVTGASIVVYLGHGNGWPSRYRDALYPPTQNGFGLNPVAGVDNRAHQYFGEASVGKLQLAPNAVVILSHLCYASGNTEPGLPEGSRDDSIARVDNYAAGFLRAGAAAVVAEGHLGPAYYVRALLAGRQRIEQIWNASPSAHGNTFALESRRSPGYTERLDPDRASGGFYRSLVSAGVSASAVRAGATGRGTIDALVEPPAVPSLTGLGIDFGAPTLADRPVAGTPTRLTLPLPGKGSARLPKGAEVGVRWEPILLDAPVIAPTGDATTTAASAGTAASTAGAPATGAPASSTPPSAAPASAAPVASPRATPPAVPATRPASRPAAGPAVQPGSTTVTESPATQPAARRAGGPAAAPAASPAATRDASPAISPTASPATGPAGSPAAGTPVESKAATALAEAPPDPPAATPPPEPPDVVLVVPEQPASEVTPAKAKVTKAGLVIRAKFPSQPGLYRLVATLHTPEGTAYDAATQALLAPLIVRVGGQVAAAYGAPAALSLPGGTTAAIAVRVVNSGIEPWDAPAPPPTDPAELAAWARSSMTPARLVATWVSVEGRPVPEATTIELDPAAARPGGIGAVVLDLATPSEPGSYLLLVDVLSPSRGPLSALGSAPGLVRVAVTEPAVAAETPPAVPSGTPLAFPTELPTATPPDADASPSPTATPAEDAPAPAGAARPGGTSAATPAATSAATSAATPAATSAARPGGTSAATPAATNAATSAATPAATSAARPGGTSAATPAATSAATPAGATQPKRP